MIRPSSIFEPLRSWVDPARVLELVIFAVIATGLVVGVVALFAAIVAVWP